MVLLITITGTAIIFIDAFFFKELKIREMYELIGYVFAFACASNTIIMIGEVMYYLCTKFK